MNNEPQDNCRFEPRRGGGPIWDEEYANAKNPPSFCHQWHVPDGHRASAKKKDRRKNAKIAEVAGTNTKQNPNDLAEIDTATLFDISATSPKEGQKNMRGIFSGKGRTASYEKKKKTQLKLINFRMERVSESIVKTAKKKESGKLR